MKRLELALEGGPSADAGALEVRRFAVHEGLSSLFEVDLFCRSKKNDVDLAAILNRGATFRLDTAVRFHQFRVRVWNGVVSRAELVQVEHVPNANETLSTYFIRIKPRLWCLSHRKNHRIFQRKTIPQIVKAIFDEWKLPFTEELGRHTYHPHDYIVQYGESDYHFVTRLLERAGITFAFRFDGESPTELVLTDQPHTGSARPALTFTDAPNGAAEKEAIYDLRLSHRVAPGRVTVRDFDFRRNLDFALVGEATPAPDPEKFYERYHYMPGETVRIDPPNGDTLATERADDKGQVRSGFDLAKERAERILEAERRLKRSVAFRGTVADLFPGRIFNVKSHPRDDLTKDLLVTEFTIEGTYEASDVWLYEGEAVFTDVPYTPDEVTPKPRIKGVQSAVVVGPNQKEIWCDEFGRVRVQFLWDRHGEWNDNSSCWLRVNYGWAGAAFGHITIPRVGQEVLVSFLEGDPDHPVVLGRVYNQTVPIPSENGFPRYKTRSTWMSDTEHEDDGSHFNEIRMEDVKDGEFMYVQAQKNLQKLVKNDETERTGQNRAIVIGQDRRAVVGEADAVLVGAKYSLQMMEPTDKDKLLILTLGKPPVTPKPTKLEMLDQKIMLTSSRASAELEKKEIIFEAKKNIHIKAGGSVIVKGGPNIKINSGTVGNAVQGGKQSSREVDALKKSGALNALDEATLLLAAQSPTLTAQLVRLQSQGWTIEKGAAGGGSYANRSTKTITVEDGQSPEDNVQTLAHEAGHATYNPPYIKPAGLTRQEYIDQNVQEDLRDEGQAQFNSAQVRQELLDAGQPDIGIPGGGDYQTPYDAYTNGDITQDQAIDQMAQTMGNETTSTTGENYKVYYGKAYEQHWDQYGVAQGGVP